MATLHSLATVQYPRGRGFRPGCGTKDLPAPQCQATDMHKSARTQLLIRPVRAFSVAVGWGRGKRSNRGGVGRRIREAMRKRRGGGGGEGV